MDIPETTGLLKISVQVSTVLLILFSQLLKVSLKKKKKKSDLSELDTIKLFAGSCTYGLSFLNHVKLVLHMG